MDFLQREVAMSTRTIIEDAYKAYREGRAQDAFINCAQDFKFHWAAQPGQTRWSAVGVDLQAMFAKFSELAQTYDYLAYDVKTLVADGDHAAAEVQVCLRHKKTGTMIEMTVADFWTIRDGEITSLTEYFDTAMILAIDGGATVDAGEAG